MSILTDLETAIFAPARKIGPLVADITIQEKHTDSLTITSHPVEQGAKITDSAFKNPAQLSIQAGWSNSTIGALVDTATSLLGFITGKTNTLSLNYGQSVYEALLDLQASCIPFDIYTGKRKYSNMLIKILNVVTINTTEYSLLVDMECEEVIIVNTYTTLLPPPDQQANPEKTQDVTNTGNNNLTPGTNFQGTP